MSNHLKASELFSNAHVTIGCDYSQRVLVVARSPNVFESIEDIEAATAALARVFPLSQRARFCILNDYRIGPLRVHPALEPAFNRFRAETERGFVRAALVVATAVGRLRGDRLREATSTLPMLVVESLDEALAFLLKR